MPFTFFLATGGFNIGAPVAALLSDISNALNGIPPLRWVGGLGLSIAVLTILYRLLLWPLFSMQLHTTQKMQALQPRQKELRLVHKGDPAALNKAMSDLMKEHNVNPLSSCLILPFLILPLLPFYAGVRQAAATVSPEDRHFLWIANVGQSAISAIGHDPAAIILPIIACILAVFQTKMMSGPPARKGDLISEEADVTQTINNTMVPLMVVVTFLYTTGIWGGFPQGIAIYSATQSLFMVVQAGVVLGWHNVPGLQLLEKWTTGRAGRSALAVTATSQRVGRGGSELQTVANRQQPPVVKGGDGRNRSKKRKKRR